MTACWNNATRIWDAETGEEIRVLKGHNNPIYSSLFSRDGKRVVTTNWGKTAKIRYAADWTLTKEEFLEQKMQLYQEWLEANISEPE